MLFRPGFKCLQVMPRSPSKGAAMEDETPDEFFSISE